MSDLIDRQAAIDALADYIHNVDKVMGTGHLTADDCKDAAASVFEELPSAQPGITLESAIDYLHSIGWMQEHDRTLTESAQPEIIRCKDCIHQQKVFHEDKRIKEGGYYICGCELADGYSVVCLDGDFCSRGKRRSDE